MNRKTIKIWIDYNSQPVRVKLTKGEELELNEFEYHDEGYSAYARNYLFDGETVHCEWASKSTDCDGRHGDGGIRAWTPIVDEIRITEDYFEHGIVWPVWRHELDFGVYDEFAQMANY